MKKVLLVEVKSIRHAPPESVFEYENMSNK